jgi:hypothetical protein
MNKLEQLLHRATRALILQPVRKLINDRTLDSSTILALGKISAQDAARFIDRELLSSSTMVFSNTQLMRNHFFSSRSLAGVEGAIMDFGVAEGYSTLQISDNLPHGASVSAFDAFEGLRDPWSKPDTLPGAIYLGGVVPPLLLERGNIVVVKGWVEDTLPAFIESIGDSGIGFVHLDMDVYPPTAFTLGLIRPHLNKGCLILFDDYFGFPGWRHHSHRALNDFFGRESYKVLGVSDRQLCIQVL